MEDLLFLAHRIPYPPNKGDKIRSNHVLRFLSNQYRIHLVAFYDDVNDFKYVNNLKEFCVSAKLVKLNKFNALLKTFSGLVFGRSLSVSYYKDRQMFRSVNEIVNNKKIRKAYVFSSTMAQYVPEKLFKYSILDLCDVDSDKWSQYSECHGYLMKVLYKYESVKLASEERSLVLRFRATLVVSNKEKEILSKIAMDAVDKIYIMANGVDSKYFNPLLEYEKVVKDDVVPIVFTGAMDYFANVDAVIWFVKDILPKVILKHPNIHFYIVGSNPVRVVLALKNNPNVTVTGSVVDVRPYINAARIIIAPLRIARGVQNKVLEGLAMSKPVVATPAAFDGLENVDSSGAIVAANQIEFIASINRVLDEKNISAYESGRQYVCRFYDWDKSLSVLNKFLDF